MDEFQNLPNIGAEVTRQLREAGIETAAQLKEEGAKAVWRKIRENDPSACANRLYALEGAIRGVKKSELPEDVKADLKLFYREETQNDPGK